MAINVKGAKRGWRYDKVNARMECYVDGTKMFYLDPSSTYMLLDGIDIQLDDNDFLRFGDATGGDVNINWTGSALGILPAVDDTGYIAIGNGTKDMDIKAYLGTSAKYVLFDVGNSYLYLCNTSLYAPQLATSAGQAGIVYVTANGYLVQSD